MNDRPVFRIFGVIPIRSGGSELPGRGPAFVPSRTVKKSALRLVFGLAVLEVIIAAFAFISLWGAAWYLTYPDVPAYILWLTLIAIIVVYGAAGIILGRRHIAEAKGTLS